MKGTVLFGAGDVRVVEREDPRIIEPTDAIIRITMACICGSDLWPYRGIDIPHKPVAMGHEYVGIVEEVGSEVSNVKPGQFVVGSFVISDNTCPICQAGYQSRCVNYQYVHGSIGTFPPKRSRAACWPPQMFWVRAGSRPTPPQRDRARRSSWSGMEQSGYWGCYRRRRWVPSASS
jgi:Zn-dependent alcohol dehydrogenase